MTEASKTWRVPNSDKRSFSQDNLAQEKPSHFLQFMNICWKNDQNLTKPMTTNQQILPATIFKASKSERGMFLHKPPNDIFIHPADDLLISFDRMKNWKLVPYSIRKFLKEGEKKLIQIQNYCTLSLIQPYTVCVKYCERKPKTQACLDFKCYFPDKWYLCLFKRCTFSASLAHKFFIICSLQYVFTTRLNIICPYISNRYTQSLNSPWAQLKIKTLICLDHLK